MTSAVDAGSGNTLTLTTTNGGPLSLTTDLTASGGTVDLVSAGALTQTAGVVTAGTLTGSSTGGASLTDANLFDTLAGFTNTGPGAVSINDAQISGLTVTSVLNAGTGNTLTLTTSGGPLTLAANLSAAGGTVDLVSAGALTQTAGVITAATLTGSSAGGASLDLDARRLFARRPSGGFHQHRRRRYLDPRRSGCWPDGDQRGGRGGGEHPDPDHHQRRPTDPGGRPHRQRRDRGSCLGRGALPDGRDHYGRDADGVISGWGQPDRGQPAREPRWLHQFRRRRLRHHRCRGLGTDGHGGYHCRRWPSPHPDHHRGPLGLGMAP